MALLDRCDGHYIATPQIIWYIVVLKVSKLYYYITNNMSVNMIIDKMFEVLQDN